MTDIRKYYLTEGNAARQAVIPEEEWQRREERRRTEEKKRRKAQQRRNAAAMRRNKIYTVYLVLAAAVLSGFFVSYVRLQNDINMSMRHIAAAESEISELRSQNQAAENRINAAANLQMVKDTATNHLGMVYANADQIVYYTVEETDYMSQYADLP